MNQNEQVNENKEVNNPSVTPVPGNQVPNQNTNSIPVTNTVQNNVQNVTNTNTLNAQNAIVTNQAVNQTINTVANTNVVDPVNQTQTVVTTPNNNSQPVQIQPNDVINANSNSETTPNPPVDRNELKEVKIDENKKDGNLKYILLIIFFIGVFVLLFFLPNLSEYINIKLNSLNSKNQVIQTGRLICTRKKADNKYDYEYEATFNYTDLKLKKLTFVTTVKGDSKKDSEDLEKMYDNCSVLSDLTDQTNGVVVSCDLSKGIYTNKEILDYQSIDDESLSSTFSEHGGVFPEYNLDENITKVKKSMSNYTCQYYK